MALNTDNLSVRQVAAVAAAFHIALFFSIRKEDSIQHDIAIYAIAVGLPALLALVVTNAAVVIGGISKIDNVRNASYIEAGLSLIGFGSVAVAFDAVLWMEASWAGGIFLLCLIIGIYSAAKVLNIMMAEKRQSHKE